MSADQSNIKDAILAGRESAKIDQRVATIEDQAGVPVLLVGADQKLEVPAAALAELKKRKAGPRRREGVANHHELDSFVEHVNRFKSDHSVIWADQDQTKLVAVLDYHPKGPDPSKTQWCAHQSVYDCPLAEEWQLWRRLSGGKMRQDEFAEFLEDRLEDLTSGEGYPDPMAVLEMVRTLRVLTKGHFERKIDRTTGEFTHINKLEHESKSTKIHRAFLLKLPVFLGGDLWKVEARVRFKVDSGIPVFGFDLHRADEIQREAFAEVRAKVVEGTNLTVFAGKPE